MANIFLRENVQTSTTIGRVPAISVQEQNGVALARAPEVPANVPKQGAMPRAWHTQDQTNISGRNLIIYTAKRLLILFDIVATILLIVLLGDDEDDLRLHPAFVRSMESWRRQQKLTCDW